MMAILGAGGVGRSQLALELAHRTKERNTRRSVFWIETSDVDGLDQAYATIARKLHVSGWDDEKADVRLLVNLYLSRKGTRPWLLICDNANDGSLGPPTSSTPRSTNLLDYLLPQSELESIVFTRTNSNRVKQLAMPNTIELQVMTPNVAQTMLENYLTTPVPISERQEMMLSLKELSYLPLAIVQAAAYINIRNITLKD